MLAEELKTGNFVTINDSNEYVKIEDIISSKNEVTLLFKNGNKITKNLNDVYPIELSENIVKNSGIHTYHSKVIFDSEIKKYEKEGWPLPYNENPYNYYFDTNFGRINFYYGNFTFYTNIYNSDGIRFKYIHELQNILNHIHIEHLRNIIDNPTIRPEEDKNHFEYYKKYGQELIDKFDLWKQNK